LGERIRERNFESKESHAIVVLAIRRWVMMKRNKKEQSETFETTSVKSRFCL